MESKNILEHRSKRAAECKNGADEHRAYVENRSMEIKREREGAMDCDTGNDYVHYYV